MTNFDFLQNDPQFAGFSEAAIGAERLDAVDAAACAIGCRRAMEFAVKWMYSVDAALILPYSDNLFALMNAEEFREVVGTDLYRRMDYVRRVANDAAHAGRKVTRRRLRLRTSFGSWTSLRAAMQSITSRGSSIRLC